jgi:hypothetical protein
MDIASYEERSDPESLVTLYEWKELKRRNDKLTPTLVGIVSVFQNLRSTLLLPFHSVSSAYLPPPRGILTGMFKCLDLVFGEPVDWRYDLGEDV